MNWNVLFFGKSVDEITEIFTSTFLNTINVYIPSKTITINDKDAPWITPAVKCAIKKNKRVYKKWVQRGRIQNHYENVKKILKETNCIIIQAKRKHIVNIGNKLCDPLTGQKEFWSVFKTDPVLELLEEHIGRVEARYPEVLGRVETRAARSRLAKLIFLIEAAGGLDDKEPMPLYLVAPTGELAGDFLGNFGGLFSRQWREADFRAGRRDARRVMESALGDVISYEADQEAAYQVPELDASYDALSRAQRHTLEKLIEARIGRQIATIDVGPLGSLLGFLWRPAVRRWATRRLIDFLRGQGVAS